MKRADRQGRRWVDGGRWEVGVEGSGGKEGDLGEGRKVEKDDEKRAGGDKRGVMRTHQCC